MPRTASAILSRRTIWKKAGIACGTLLLIFAASALYFKQELVRIHFVLTLFEPDVIVENFRDMTRVFDSHTVHRKGVVYELARHPSPLPETFTYRGKRQDLNAWIQRTDTAGLIVIHDEKVAFEHYYKGNTAGTRWISWSVGKSLVSAMVGFALQDGSIRSLSDPVTDYAPSLSTSGYDGVAIKDVLQMSSGIRFNEDYGDFHSDINRMGRTFALGTSMEAFVLSLKNARPPGTYHHYVSMDTQVLGMVLQKATGQSLSAYLEKKLWSQLGMDSDALWIVDGEGMELAFGTLNAVLRDYARFGLFYLNEGRDHLGRQLLSADYVKASVTPDAPHLFPGLDNTASNTSLGYGYQWWLPETPDGDFCAIGVYGQFIYVHPRHNVVIAKNSAYVDYNQSGDEMEFESLAAFRAIARHLDR